MSKQVESGELNDKQKLFCKEYLIDLNGTQAAVRAGYSEKTAPEQSSRLLSNVKISEYLKTLMDARAEKVEVDANWVLQRFIDISNRCMTAEPVMVKNDDGEWVESGQYQFDSAGANKATEQIAKHIGFFSEDNKQRVLGEQVFMIGGQKIQF